MAFLPPLLFKPDRIHSAEYIKCSNQHSNKKSWRLAELVLWHLEYRPRIHHLSEIMETVCSKISTKRKLDKMEMVRLSSPYTIPQLTHEVLYPRTCSWPFLHTHWHAVHFHTIKSLPQYSSLPASGSLNWKSSPPSCTLGTQRDQKTWRAKCGP